MISRDCSIRRRGSQRALGAVLFALLAVAASAQSAPAGAYDGGDVVVLRTLWDVVGPGEDRMSTPNLSEILSLPFEGAVAYIPSSVRPGYVPLRRFYNSNGDHRDCTCNSLPGYASEGVMGYVASSPAAGQEQLVTGNNGSDHASFVSDSPPAGYTTDAVHGYAWPRYGNDAESIISTSANGTTVESNLVAGGAVWRWTAGGVEFLDQYDYGRLMQAAVFWTDRSSALIGPLRYANPTEAGDVDDAAGLPPARRHGSPVIHVSADPLQNRQSTRSVPLEWNPSRWGGNAADAPVLWKDVIIGKDIYLGFAGLDDVALYETVLTLPQALSSWTSGPLQNPANTVQRPSVEVPTAYLDHSFNEFYTYDAGENRLNEVEPPPNDGHGVGFVPQSGYGGVLVADSDDRFASHAMGIYGATTWAANGGSVSEFRLYDFPSPAGGGPTSKFNAVRNSHIPGGTTTFRTWIITGSIDDVVARMDALHAMGAH